MKIYLVVNEWASEDPCGVGTIPFSTIEKARAEMDRQIEDEKREFWVQAFDENGNVLDGYEIAQDDLYWEIYKTGYYSQSHTVIEIRELEVL